MQGINTTFLLYTTYTQSKFRFYPKEFRWLKETRHTLHPPTITTPHPVIVTLATGPKQQPTNTQPISTAVGHTHTPSHHHHSHHHTSSCHCHLGNRAQTTTNKHSAHFNSSGAHLTLQVHMHTVHPRVHKGEREYLNCTYPRTQTLCTK